LLHSNWGFKADFTIFTGEALHEAYTYYFFRYVKSLLLIINAEHIDFVKNPNEWEELVRQIATVRHHGTTYFNPVPSSINR